MDLCLTARILDPLGMEVLGGVEENSNESETQANKDCQLPGSQLYCVAGGLARSEKSQCRWVRMEGNMAVHHIAYPRNRSR